MPRIFISYRRADSIGITGRIYDRMVAAFGKENVFQDVEDIPFGVDFRKFLREQVAACDLVIVVIGRQWINIQDEHGKRRLDNPADFVRIEVENALSQNKVVIPVLVDNAVPPREEELPASMQELCYRNAAIVRHNPDFDRDVSKLINAIQNFRQYTPSPQDFTSSPVDYADTIRFGRATITQDPSPVKRIELVPPDVSKILPPPFEWCEIPAGKVTLEAGGYLKAPTTFEVERFWMAKYPITNAQYQIFVQAEDGYRNAKWWDYAEAAKEWRQKNSQPQKTAFEGNDLPRTNVTWYDAVAFGRWLSAVLTPQPPLQYLERGSQQRFMITLPTEQQWQRAAQGDDERAYPWGNEFDRERCNTKESGIGQVSPVPQYLAGESPFHVLDMSGNVWEWCLTQWGSGRQLIEQVVGGNDHVLRGGGYYFNAKYARCAFRLNYPSVRLSYLGFRVVSLPI